MLQFPVRFINFIEVFFAPMDTKGCVLDVTLAAGHHEVTITFSYKFSRNSDSELDPLQ